MTDTPTTTDETTDDTPDSGNAEAAKYRRRLRDVEADRDTLASKVDALRRQQLAASVADRLRDPDDLERHGTALADLVNDEGDIDTDAVEQAVTNLLDERPHLAAGHHRHASSVVAGEGNPSPFRHLATDGFETAFTPPTTVLGGVA